MSDKFIAYFDFLGFQNFIENNNSFYQKGVMKSIFTEIEMALSLGESVLSDGFAKAKLSVSKVNCINFSDTIIFWTNSMDFNSLEELLKVSHRFNAFCNIYTFPIRGAISKGEISHYKFNSDNVNNSTYNANSIFGKGLINAYLKAESQNWAGTVIDSSIVDFLNKNSIDDKKFLSLFSKKYLIPYKGVITSQKEEWALNLVENNQTIKEETFLNIKRNITENFSKHNKCLDNKEIQQKIRNTIDFLITYKQ